MTAMAVLRQLKIEQNTIVREPQLATDQPRSRRART
jgi:hypothetical protein